MGGTKIAERDNQFAGRLRGWSEPLPSPEDPTFADALGAFGSARVVLLGEATHGSSEFYRARSAITRRLIERHGFSIVAVEADWPDAAHIDHHVRHRTPDPAADDAFARFPVWMWRNTDMADFVAWLRGFNETRPETSRVAFRGLDLYRLRAP